MSKVIFLKKKEKLWTVQDDNLLRGQTFNSSAENLIHSTITVEQSLSLQWLLYVSPAKINHA